MSTLSPLGKRVAAEDVFFPVVDVMRGNKDLMNLDPRLINEREILISLRGAAAVELAGEAVWVTPNLRDWQPASSYLC